MGFSGGKEGEDRDQERNTYRTLPSSLFHPDGHLAIIKHPFQCVFQVQELLREFLIQNVDFILQLSSFGAHSFGLRLSFLLDLSAELTACCAKEVCLLYSPD